MEDAASRPTGRRPFMLPTKEEVADQVLDLPTDDANQVLKQEQFKTRRLRAAAVGGALGLIPGGVVESTAPKATAKLLDPSVDAVQEAAENLVLARDAQQDLRAQRMAQQAVVNEYGQLRRARRSEPSRYGRASVYETRLPELSQAAQSMERTPVSAKIADEMLLVANRLADPSEVPIQHAIHAQRTAEVDDIADTMFNKVGMAEPEVWDQAEAKVNDVVRGAGAELAAAENAPLMRAAKYLTPAAKAAGKLLMVAGPVVGAYTGWQEAMGTGVVRDIRVKALESAKPLSGAALSEEELAALEASPETAQQLWDEGMIATSVLKYIQGKR